MAGSEINSLYLKNSNLSKKYHNLLADKEKYKKKDNSQKINPDYLVDISITARMKANHYSMVQALNNNKNSSQMLESVQGYLSRLTEIVQRIDYQNTKLSNQPLASREYQLIEIELSELIDEIDRIVSHATFNKINLLDGAFSKINPRASMWIQFGHKPEQRARIYLATMSSRAMQLDDFKKMKLSKKNINKALDRIYNQQKTLKNFSNKIELQTKKILAELHHLIKSKNAIIHDNEIKKLIEKYEEEYK